MKATATKVRSKGNFDPKDSFDMTFDEKNRAKLSNVFIDIYEDLDAAIIREYAANGFDAHTVAGQTRPIQVTLPNIENNAFMVEDFGVGMSLEDFKKYFAKFGGSSKDEDNDTIGSYGLGCKAALAIVPSFTVSTTKDGVTTVVIISRSEKSLGRVQIAFHEHTGAPNGTKVTIAVNEKHNQFAQKAIKIFRTWPENSVLINGEAPKDSIHDTDRYMNFGNRLYLNPIQHPGATSYTYTVNMGGIGYDVKESQMREIMANLTDPKLRNFNLFKYNVVLNVGIGDVDLISNRESVRWTKRSMDAAVKALEEGLHHGFVQAQEILDKAQTIEDFYSAETIEKMTKVPEFFDRNMLNWKGEELPSDIGFNNLLWEYGFDTKHAFLTKTACVLHDGARQQKHFYSMPKIQFGFTSDSSVKNFLTDNNKSNHWIFVDVRNETDRKYSILSSTVRSIIKHHEYRSTRVVYVVDDLIEKNPWLQAMINVNPNISLYTLTEMKDFLAEKRKEKAKLRPAGEKKEVAYSIYVPEALKVGQLKDFYARVYTATELNDYVAENKNVDLFADNTIFTRKNIDKRDNFAPFVPDNAIIVLLENGKTLNALQNKLKVQVRSDLNEVISANAIAELETLNFAEFFITVSMGYGMRRSLRNLSLTKGFMKKVTESKEDYSVSRFVSNLRALKDAELISLPDLEAYRKVEDIKKELPLFFESNTNPNIHTDSYWKHLSAYIDSASDTIEKIIAREG